MGPSYAPHFLATTKVRIQLWSFLNRFRTGPVDPERVLQQMGPSEPAPTSAPCSTGCPL